MSREHFLCPKIRHGWGGVISGMSVERFRNDRLFCNCWVHCTSVPNEIKTRDTSTSGTFMTSLSRATKKHVFTKRAQIAKNIS